MGDAGFDTFYCGTLMIQDLQHRVMANSGRGKYIKDLRVDVEALRLQLVTGREQDALEPTNELKRLRVEAEQVLERNGSNGLGSTEFQDPRSKIQRAVICSQPFACWAPPRRKECDVSATVVPAAGATRSRTRFTCAPTATGGALRSSTSGTSGDSVTAVCWTWLGSLSTRAEHDTAWTVRARATASKGQVAKSASGKSESPCSSDVLTRTKRTKKTSAASMEMFRFRVIDRSDALPNRYQSRHRRAASW
ncbi:hypothetical protein PHMEG_00027536 [Phytophthora megakarya]|uniref:Uncharacterized protein n=1 Tax=Phytophthora megakarya TaxID=4795 RepID=A0A225V8A9_9STRA|nr:hypothetical protein PHMEG_00027536 [Phytophthora megakarya]